MADSSPSLDPYQGVRVSAARFVVTSGSIAAGQIIFGESDVPKIVKRSVVGALITEATAFSLRVAQDMAAREQVPDLLWLASCGPEEVARMYRAFLEVRLHGTQR